MKMLKISKTAKASAPADPLAELLADLTAQARAALAEHDAAPVAKSMQAKVADALTKAAVNFGLLSKSDAPQHSAMAEPPTASPSAYQRQRARNTAFITSLAREGFGDNEPPLNQP